MLSLAAGRRTLRAGPFLSSGDNNMSTTATRRQFLSTAASATAFAGATQLGFLAKLPSVSAQEASASGNVVKLADDIEPLVRLIEETPKERLLEEVAGRIRKGTSYREIVA